MNTRWRTPNPTGHIGASLPAARTTRACTLSSANDVRERDPMTWASGPATMACSGPRATARSAILVSVTDPGVNGLNKAFYQVVVTKVQ